MKAADLRTIVERTTDAPWFARGRFLSRVPDNTGMGGTLETNHIGIVAEPEDAAGIAALRNHAAAWIALQEAVGRLLELRELTGWEIEAALEGIGSAHRAIEALP